MDLEYVCILAGFLCRHHIARGEMGGVKILQKLCCKLFVGGLKMPHVGTPRANLR